MSCILKYFKLKFNIFDEKLEFFIKKKSQAKAKALKQKVENGYSLSIDSLVLFIRGFNIIT